MGMTVKITCWSRRFWYLSSLLLSVCSLRGQPQDRLVNPLDSRRTVVLRGTWNPRAASFVDEGPLADSQRIEGLQVRFKPSPAQSAALAQLLDEQQNSASPRYHSWLTPEEFGDCFGLSANDFARVKDWMDMQGFRVDVMARSRTFIIFSATAGQVRHTLDTELHQYRAAGRTHFANAAEVRVPGDLAPLVWSITGLDDFAAERYAQNTPAANLSNGRHKLMPGDLATIYNIKPLYERGLSGSRQKIVIPGHTDFHLEDVQAYRTQLGLPNNDPKRILVPGYRNPGNDADGEALLDLEIAGAIAPDATILFVFAPEFWAALQYAVDENLAPVISTSVGGCEADFVSFGATDVMQFVAQQANAQGITWVAGSGDSGGAGCEPQITKPAGLRGMVTTLAASLPEVTGVGGTEFAEGTERYWSDSAGPDMASALSYIPEIAWNDTAEQGGLAATGGGISAVYTKPVWQSGPGVPNDNARHVPDIAFSASWNHDAYHMIYHGRVTTSGGTSATGPFFAGVLALLNQHVVTSGLQDKPGLGNINPRLYQLAQTVPDAFHDITSGDNIVPCQPETRDCESSGSYGFLAGPGYDHATGLGSIDIDKLFRNWGRP
jgi:subtilase family serine protease